MGGSIETLSFFLRLFNNETATTKTMAIIATPPPTPPAMAVKLSFSCGVDGSRDVLGKGVIVAETDVRDAKALETNVPEIIALESNVLEFDICEDELAMMG